jgi:hypothetical protein
VTRFPNLFIIGAPKSGTTSLYEYLKGHPEVHMSPLKEPNYFAPDLARDISGNSMLFERDESEYLALFAQARGVPVIGEGSTRYMYSRRAPALIHAAAPDARIVAMVRNPIDMIYSLHAHKLSAGTEDIADFEQALAAEGDRAAGTRLPPHSNPLLATYRDRARFGEQLTRWFDEFGRDRVHVIVFEDLLAAPDAEFRKVLEFLGIDPEYRPASFAAHNAAHGSRSALVRRLVLSSPAQWLAWRALPRIVGGVRAREMVAVFSQSRLRRRKIQRESVPPALRARLEKDFDPDVTVLSALLGRDLRARWFGRPLAPVEPAVEPLAAS